MITMLTESDSKVHNIQCRNVDLRDNSYEKEKTSHAIKSSHIFNLNLVINLYTRFKFDG